MLVIILEYGIKSVCDKKIWGGADKVVRILLAIVAVLLAYMDSYPIL